MERSQNEIVELRAHHLLCSVLYIGKGYDGEFEDNMHLIVNRLKEGCRMIIKKSPDEICAECPNRMDDGGCALDINKVNNDGVTKIHSLDELVMNRFSIEENNIYDSANVYQKIKDTITKDDFDYWCGKCRWNEEGLCSFDKYMSRIDMFCNNSSRM